MKRFIRLTRREVQVLQLLAHGCTYAQAGAVLRISVHTVASYTKTAYRKLNVHSAASAVMRALELRLIGREKGAQDEMRIHYRVGTPGL